MIDKRAPVEKFDCVTLVEQTEGRERLHKRAETRISKADCNYEGVDWEGSNTLKSHEQRSLLLGSGRGRGHRFSYRACYLCWEVLRAGMEWEVASSESRT